MKNIFDSHEERIYLGTLDSPIAEDIKDRPVFVLKKFWALNVASLNVFNNCDSSKHSSES